MAVRLTSASSQALRRTTDLVDHNADFTVMYWIQPVTVSIWQALWFSGNNTAGSALASESFEIHNTTNKVTWGPSDNAGVAICSVADGLTALAAGTDYHVAFARRGPVMDCLLDGISQGVCSGSIAGRNAAVAQEIGRWSLNADFGNFRVSAYKAWTYGMQPDEVLVERPYAYPIRQKDLHAYYKLQSHTDLTDSSVYQRSAWTAVGTPTTEADPLGVSFIAPTISDKPGDIAGLMT